ncbi:calcium/calmodulin-dependent protein kinase [Achlya hypogyna]|uniref:Calcium/calmodulin-dependent protein kinase n=1 Tax=Achlya hypogyna TaxID=1202772 RepID=A0A1V9Y6B9_ACHHY|nr:calcium/calmodulin-dependent protein kinase [Achlya hypogyna]
MGLGASVVHWCCGGAKDDLPSDASCLLRGSKADNVSALVEIERDAKTDFSRNYILGHKLGMGAYATVYECGDVKTKKLYACKVYKRRGLDAGSLECALTEPYMLKRMYHPGILSCRGFYKEPETYVLVMEELKGGDIFSKLHASSEKLTEIDICRLVKMLLEALEYIHLRNIVHRDLKLENLMLDATGRDSALKIVDFGFAKQLPNKNATLTEVLGTPGYMAPEVIQGKPYGKPADIWSTGVIVYTLLCGYPPFHHDQIHDLQKLFRCICYGYYFFDAPYWDDISLEAKDLVSQMLRVPQQERFVRSQELRWILRRKTATQLLQHPWFHAHADIPAAKKEAVDMFKAIGPLKSFHRIMKARLSHRHAEEHRDSMQSLVTHKLSHMEATTNPIQIDLRNSVLLPTARGVVTVASASAP